MLKLFLWLRYLRKKKIVFLSIAAVALSVALMIVVDSLFTGYIEALREITIAETGDVFFWAQTTIPKHKVFLDKLERLDGVKAAAPFSFAGGLLYIEGADVREVMVHGIDPERESGFADWNKQLLRQAGSSSRLDFEVPDYENDEGVWLGVNILAEPNEETDKYDIEGVKSFIGKRVVLTMVGQGRKRRVKKFRVSDIVFTRTYFGDKTIYLPFEKLYRIEFGDAEADSANFIKLKLDKGIDSKLMKQIVREEWEKFIAEQPELAQKDIPGVVIRTQQEDRNDFFEDLRNQLRVVLLIFGVVCSVAVLLIFCIFYMIVTAKQKDIAIIKSLGASSISAASIFAGFGACVGIVGSVLGIILGVIVTKNINTLEEWVRVIFGMKLWRASSYGLGVIPHQVNWPAVLPIILAAISGCIIGVLIPAIIAARTKPVEILRYE